MLPRSQQQWHGLRRVGIPVQNTRLPMISSWVLAWWEHQDGRPHVKIQLSTPSKTQLANLFFHCSDFVLPTTLVIENSVFNFLFWNWLLDSCETNNKHVFFSNGMRYGNTTTKHIGSFGPASPFLGLPGPSVAQLIYEINDCIHSYSFSWLVQRDISKYAFLLILP